MCCLLQAPIEWLGANDYKTVILAWIFDSVSVKNPTDGITLNRRYPGSWVEKEGISSAQLKSDMAVTVDHHLYAHLWCYPVKAKLEPN